jgi:hypothetical protein
MAQIDWLQAWDTPFNWAGLSANQIATEQQNVETYVRNWLKKMDEALKLPPPKAKKPRHPKAKDHKIKFLWYGDAVGQSYFVIGHLTPAPTETGGGGNLLTPTPPPQP